MSERESLFSFRCRLGIHRWSKLGTTVWLDQPTSFENRYGVAMEYRTCERCGRLGDVTTWADTPDPDLGIPQKIGPLAWARMREVINGPRVALPAEPLPFCPPESWREL